MKTRILLLALAIACAGNVAGSVSHAPPKQEQLTTQDLVSKTNEVFTLHCVTYDDAYVIAIVNDLPVFTTDAKHESGFEAVQPSEEFRSVQLHDFGNSCSLAKSNYNRLSNSFLKWDSIYLSNCSIKQC